MTYVAYILLAITVFLLDAGAVLTYLWAIGSMKTVESQRDAYRLVAVNACQELRETQDLLVALAEEFRAKDSTKAGTKNVDRSWD